MLVAAASVGKLLVNLFKFNWYLIIIKFKSDLLIASIARMS